MARKVDVNEIVGTSEIAEKLGLARPETVLNWRTRYADFPEPIAKLARAYVWAWSDVEEWARSTGRL